MEESRIPGITFGEPPKAERPVIPHYILSIHIMHGDADFYEWRDVACFDIDGKHVTIRGLNVKWVTSSPKYKEAFPVTAHPILDAVLSCELAVRTYAESGKGGFDDYAEVPGFEHWSGGLPDREMGIPSVEEWKLTFVDLDGSTRPVDVKFTEEQMAYLTAYVPEDYHHDRDD